MYSRDGGPVFEKTGEVGSDAASDAVVAAVVAVGNVDQCGGVVRFSTLYIQQAGCENHAGGVLDGGKAGEDVGGGDVVLVAAKGPSGILINAIRFSVFWDLFLSHLPLPG